MTKNIFYILTFLFIVTGCQQKKDYTTVPDWAKEAVWYQIFPERFNNGDPDNDPKAIDLEGGWPYVIPADWQIHPWTSDWYKTQPWEETNEFDFYGDTGLRRYGGDLQGVIDKLDYLKDLGITAVYLNPLFESPSLHKYDAAMYRHIDNNFGPDPESDRELWATENPVDPSTWKWTAADKLFLKLVNECHKRDMKIIIDGVFNHVGNTFWAFKDVLEKQDKSEYKDWFMIESFDDPSTPDTNEFDYHGWYGVKDLPEIKEDENGLVEQPSNHVHNIVKRWMDPNGDGNTSDGIDGWRLDVAEMVNIKFWNKFRTWVRDINPDAYITGEVWWEDWQNNVMFNASPWLHGKAFDAVMNYRFTRAVKQFMIDKKDKVDAAAFRDTINTIMSQYGENYYVMMNLLGSHDTERLASLIVNPDHWYDHGAVPKDRREFDVRQPDDTEREIQKACVTLQMTMPGAPMIYYGDEVGMWGGDDPDCRKPMVWKELEYETETTHPLGNKREPDAVYFHQDLHDWYKKIINIRKDNKELSLGDIEFKVFDDGILQFTRTLGDKKSIILANNKDQESSVVLSADSGNEELTNIINNTSFAKGEDGYSVKLTPYEVMILK